MDMKKIFSILALALAAMTASAKEAESYKLTVGESEKGKIAFLVGGSESETAAEGTAVTMEITPQGGYVVKEVTNSLYTDWNSARAQAIDITTSVEMKKVTDNVYTFTMPRANVEVNVTYDIEIPTPAEDKKDEEKEVTDVKLDMEPAGAPQSVGEITIIPVSITGVEVPATAPQEIVVKVAAQTQVGNNVFLVREIKDNAFKTNDQNVKVTKVILPDTEEATDRGGRRHESRRRTHRGADTAGTAGRLRPDAVAEGQLRRQADYGHCQGSAALLDLLKRCRCHSASGRHRLSRIHAGRCHPHPAHRQG